MLTLEIHRLSGLDERNVTATGSAGTAAGACPGCGAEPFEIRCHANVLETEHGPRLGARCVNCGDAVGYVREEADTIFGAEEDRAMTTMARARVYGMEVPRG